MINVYERLYRIFDDYASMVFRCVDMDRNYLLDKSAIARLPDMLSKCEAAANCFKGFEGEKECMNSLVLCQKVYDELMEFSNRSIRLEKIEFDLIFLPHAEGIFLLASYYFGKLAAGEKPYKFAVIQHNSIFGLHAQIHYEDLTCDGESSTALLIPGKQGYLVLATDKNDINIETEFWYSDGESKDTSRIVLGDLKDGFNRFYVKMGTNDNEPAVSILPADKQFDDMRKAMGFDPDILTR